MKKAPLKLLLIITALSVIVTACPTSALAATRPAVRPYLVTNDDVFNPTTPSNTATVYKIGAGGSLTMVKSIKTGGGGIGGGYFATPRVNLLHSKTQACVYVGDANYATYGNNAPDVAAINLQTLKLAGNFPGNSTRDSGQNAGVGMADAGAYVIASFSGYGTVIPATLATYEVLSGCKLKYLGSVRASGLLLGSYANGMKATPDGKTLVVAYTDGSIGSYRISAKGKLTLIGQENTSTGAAAAGVDVTADGKFAIFGDASSLPSVDVAPISSTGKLGATVNYSGVVPGVNSNNVMLSPDESVLFISNNGTGEVGAVQFNKATGVLTPANSCSSNVLKDFEYSWFFGASLAYASTTGTVYVAEYPSSIGIVTYTPHQKGEDEFCDLYETKASPASDTNSTGLVSIGAYPPRPF
jgi:hypothetical protein